MKRFPRKRVIITGSGSGLGRALALEFARRGWRVAVAEINPERGADTVEAVGLAGGEGLSLTCDVTDPASMEKAALTLQELWSGVDILVNNAGVICAGVMEKIPLDTWNWIMNINFMGVVNGCRAFIPLLEAQGSGHIVNVASNAGIASLPEMSCYNVSKAAVISLSETLRIELVKKNIGVTAVCPTFFKTNLIDTLKSADERQHELAKRFFERSKASAELIARHIIRGIEKNRFYVIPQREGRFIWWIKRRMPEQYLRMAAWIYKHGIFERTILRARK